MKDKERIKGIIEAILFTMGESVAISRLSEVLDIEEDTLKELLEEMKGDYAGKDRGICLIELDGAYQICTKIETYEYVKKLVSQHGDRKQDAGRIAGNGRPSGTGYFCHLVQYRPGTDQIDQTCQR